MQMIGALSLYLLKLLESLFENLLCRLLDIVKDRSMIR